MKKFILIATALIAAVACDTDKNTNSWSKSIDGDMITVNTTTSVEYTDNATVTVEMKDITKPYFNLSIEGVKFVPMMPDVNFLICNLQGQVMLTTDGRLGGKSVTLPQEITSSTAHGYSIRSLSCRLLAVLLVKSTLCSTSRALSLTTALL